MIEHVENKTEIKLEGEKYWIYESYIKNGSGYTFGIYDSEEFDDRANYYSDMSYKKWVMFGKNKNFLIERDNLSEFDFIVKEYEKYEITMEEDRYLFSIFINGEKFVSFYPNGDDDFENIEVKKSKLARRKKKINNINDSFKYNL